jgi:transcriptional regulator with XRE-family HTH domain
MYRKDNSLCTFTRYTLDVPAMPTPENQFGEWLRSWRKTAGFSQEEIGKRVGVKKQHISNLERGEVSTYTGEAIRPSFDLAIKLAKALSRPIKEACDLAGYELPASGQQSPPSCIEDALHRSQYFEAFGFDADDIALIRPILEGIDRTINALAGRVSPTATEQNDTHGLTPKFFEKDIQLVEGDQQKRA